MEANFSYEATYARLSRELVGRIANVS
jgi:hypothetical protein